jgi:fucose permease
MPRFFPAGTPCFFSTAAALFVVFAGFGFFEVGINALATRVFVTKTALLMNILHAFYGIGAMLGPKAAGAVVEYTSLGWRYTYLLSLPLALVLFIPGIFTRFPEKDYVADGNTVRRKSFFDALRSPMVWLLSLTLGLEIVIEMNSTNWGPLYFQDVYGFNPTTGGASFLSTFFLVFTASRLICGPFVEKIGYTRTLLGAAIIVLIIFTAGFCLGEKGIYVLPALGFFIALLWPTIMAVAIVFFGKDAPVYSSAMIALGGLINVFVQFLVGLTNHINPAWGYRSSVVYTVFLIAVLIVLHRKFKEVVKN